MSNNKDEIESIMLYKEAKEKYIKLADKLIIITQCTYKHFYCYSCSSEFGYIPGEKCACKDKYGLKCNVYALLQKDLKRMRNMIFCGNADCGYRLSSLTWKYCPMCAGVDKLVSIHRNCQADVTGRLCSDCGNVNERFVT